MIIFAVSERRVTQAEGQELPGLSARLDSQESPRRSEPEKYFPRRYRLVDDREYCVVPACGVRSRNLDADGICPPELWDEKHDRYALALRKRARRSA